MNNKRRVSLFGFAEKLKRNDIMPTKTSKLVLAKCFQVRFVRKILEPYFIFAIHSKMY